MSYRYRELVTLLQQSQPVQQTLQTLDSYDDPCFVVMDCGKLPPTDLHEFLTEQLSIELYTSDWQIINGRLLFVYIDMDKDDALILVDELTAHLAEQQALETKVSVFRHNPIGNAADTLIMTIMQLDELLQNAEQSVALNDYKDRRNWPGIDNYRARMKAEAEAASGGFIKRGLGKLFGRKAAAPEAADDVDECDSEESSATPARTGNETPAEALAWELLPFAPQQALLDLAPFIYYLPNGEALWRYVLTGERRAELLADNSLLNLDRVLVVLHAKQYAPAFLAQIQEEVSASDLSEQQAVAKQLYFILQPLAEELLDKRDHTKAREQCYLGVLDIFFHLFDEQLVSKLIYQQLVLEETAFLLQSEYDAYFTSSADKAHHSSNSTEDIDTPLNSSQQQLINELLESLEDSAFVDADNLRDIRNLHDQGRHVCNPAKWPLTDEYQDQLLAAILLALDSEQGIDDEYTAKLAAFVDDKLPAQVAAELSDYYHLADKKTLPESVMTWLKGDGDFAQVSSMASVLDECLGRSYHSSAEAQTEYHIFGSVKDFHIVLRTCFWRELAGGTPLSARLIAIALQLAPIASLVSFAKLYAGFFGKFADEQAEKAFYAALQTIKVAPEWVFAFKVRTSQQHDAEQYSGLIEQYYQADATQQTAYNQALRRVKPKVYQRFYADVHTLHEDFVYPFADEWQQVLALLNIHVSHTDEKAFAAHFAKDEVLFAGYSDFCPQKYQLPIIVTEHTQHDPEAWHYAVLRLEGEQLVAVRACVDAEREEGIRARDLVIMCDSVSDEQILAVVPKVLTREARLALLNRVSQQFINGEISFAEYAQQIEYQVAVKDYAIDFESYDSFIGTLLPLIEVERDPARQLRFIKLLTIHPSKGKRILEQICLQLFLGQACRRGELPLAKKYDVEVADLSAEAKQALRALLKDFQQQLAALV
ncbi:hypothetical protein [Shewanella sp.]|uniref:hypothetical protein n=1 Tax=Shewanella sp. TaxID=50422 RepID=UPI003A986AE6